MDKLYTLKFWKAFLLYLLLTVIFTWPAAIQLGTRVIGGSDAFMFLWDIWWFKYALLTLHISPLINNTIYYPMHNIPMVWSTPVNELGSIPFQYIFGNLITYNLLIILHLTLSGFFAFIFLRKLVKSDLPAFIGGVVYTFSSYHFLTITNGTLGLVTIEFIPLFMYGFINFLETQNAKNFILMTTMAVLTALSDPYIAVTFLFTFVIVFVLYALLSNRKLILTKRRFVGFLLSGVITVVITSYFYLPMIHTVNSLQSAYTYSHQAIFYSSDVLSYFMPTMVNFLWGRLFVDSGLDVGVPNYFIGYTVILLASVGIIKSKLQYKNLYLFFLATAFILSLGPYLRVNGPVVVHFYNTSHLIPMPYYAMWKIPILKFLRYPNRFAMDIELMLAIFVSAAICPIMKKNAKTIVLALVLSVIIPLGTKVGTPFSTSGITVDAYIPSIYKTIKYQPNIKVIYELPSGQEYHAEYVGYAYLYMYYQTYHHKPIVYGHIPRPPNHGDNFTLLHPLLQVLSEPGTISSGDIINRNVKDYIPYGIKTLRNNHIRVILLHKRFISPAFNEHTEKVLYKLLVEAFGKPIIEDNDVAMFFVPYKKIPPLKPIIYLGKGWYLPGYYKNGVAYRWMSNNAEVRLSHWKGGYANIKFSIFRAFNKIKTLDVFLDTKRIAHLDISSIASPYIGKITIPSVYLHGGNNTIVFHVEEGPYEPFYMHLGFPDLNPYSLAMSLIKIKPVQE